MENKNIGKINRPVPKTHNLKIPPANTNKKTHFGLKNMAKGSAPQPTINPSIAFTSIISYVVIGLILLVAAILYIASINNTPKSPNKPHKTRPQESKKTDLKNPIEATEGRALTQQEQQQCTQALQDLNDVAKIIDKYTGMQKEELTEADKEEIRNASKKMDAALATITQLTENTGTQILGGTKHINNRQKLTGMMRDAGIPR